MDEDDKHLKLFVAELNLLVQQNISFQNAIIQARIYLGVIFAYVLYLLSTSQNTLFGKKLPAISFIFILLSVYWYDQFVKAYMRKIKERYANISKAVLNLGKAGSKDIQHFKQIRGAIGCKEKFKLLWPLEFEHWLFYFPLLCVCLFVIIWSFC